MYAESPGISYVHLVGSVDASCGSFLILSTDCLTAVYFSVFAHDFYLPSTEFTWVNVPFAAGMPIVSWQNFPMTDRNVLKSTHPLWLISFRVCKQFHVYLVLVLFTFLIRKKYTLALSFLFSAGPIPFKHFPLILGLGYHLWRINVVGRLCVSYGGFWVIGLSDFPLILDGRYWWNHPSSPSLFSVIFRLLPFSNFLLYGIVFIPFPGIIYLSAAEVELFQPEHFCRVLPCLFLFL